MIAAKVGQVAYDVAACGKDREKLEDTGVACSNNGASCETDVLSILDMHPFSVALSLLYEAPC